MHANAEAQTGEHDLQFTCTWRMINRRSTERSRSSKTAIMPTPQTTFTSPSTFVLLPCMLVWRRLLAQCQTGISGRADGKCALLMYGAGAGGHELLHFLRQPIYQLLAMVTFSATILNRFECDVTFVSGPGWWNKPPASPMKSDLKTDTNALHRGFSHWEWRGRWDFLKLKYVLQRTRKY